MRFCLLLLLLVGCGERDPRTDSEGARSLEEAAASADTVQFDLELGAPDSSAGRGGRDRLRADAPPAPPASPRPQRREGERPAETEGLAPADGRFALLVGVSDYPGTRDDLPSGELDVAVVRSLLVERYGFRAENVVTLTDRGATRGALRRAIAQHLGQAGTTAFFYFSGHGVRLGSNVGRADDEREGRDEAIYLWADGGRGGALVLDDEIGAWTGALRAERVLVVLDACHSGTGSRGASPGAPPVKEVVVDSVARRLDPSAPWSVPSRAPTGREVILLAAARDREPAYAGLPGQPSLFTATLARVLREAPGRTPITDVMARVRARVEEASEAYGRSHSPQLEGGRSYTLADLFARDP